MKTIQLSLFLLFLSSFTATFSQNYFFEEFTPFDENIPTPEAFLGYKIGEQHTRHDQIVAYFEKLAELSDKVTLEEYGRTYENRKLLMMTISTKKNISNLAQIKEKHLALVNPDKVVKNHTDLPLFIHLGYNIHGNEPSGSEAALLAAYTLIASKNKTITDYLEKAIFFIDPTINPDGRDRHTQWVNSRKAKNLVADRLDFEHTESWPSGRSNHYWFDLNRDWLLGVHPESQAKLKWFHNWYPSIVTDFHEMGTSMNSYFFEPKKRSSSLIPLVPKENEELNKLFAKEFAKSLEETGTYYFTGDIFDATYPGYGSTYGDLQSALALLFEQSSTRGHLMKTVTGTMSFPFAIRNQYISTMTTIKTAVQNKGIIHDYQQNFFNKSRKNARKDTVKAYVFGDENDQNRTKEFIKLLFQHKINVYKLDKNLKENGMSFKKGKAFVVPTEQNQYKMVQSMFETYDKYRDSVYYDASAWSVVNFYNMPYIAHNKKIKVGNELNLNDLSKNTILTQKADYAYMIPWEDYYTPTLLFALQEAGIKVKTLTKPLKSNKNKTFNRGTLVIPISLQNISGDSIYSVIDKQARKLNIQVSSINAGENGLGINLGSRHLSILQKPKVLLWVGDDVSAYEAGEVWHLLDTRVNLPLSKIALRNFNRVDLNKYNTMVMVSGKYHQLDSVKRKKIQNWVAQGNTLITSRNASKWAIKKKLVKESLIKKAKDSTETKRLNYGDAYENKGREALGGAIFRVNLDVTHPIGYGYIQNEIPVYRNSTVWLKPSKNAYSTVAKYVKDAHIDGFISDKNYNLLSKSASIIVSPIGKGRVVMFADNPNFRGAWYGTNKLFLNAIFFGNQIRIPK